MDNIELKNIIQSNYKLNVEKISKNEQSTDGNVYILNCLTKKYIAKIYNDIEHSKSMIELYKYLIEKGINVPKVIETKGNRTYVKYNKKYIVIYSFLKGVQISDIVKNNRIDNETIVSIAKELRKLHNCTTNIRFNLKEIDFANKSNRKSVIHFDLTKENIFIDNGKISFIDFDDAKYGDCVCDIAIIISLLFISKKRGIDSNGIKTFIDSYYEDSEKLKKTEKFLIKQYAVDWVEYILKNNKFDTSTKESFEFKRQTIKNNWK